MMVLFLITNYDSTKETSDKPLQIKPSGYIRIFAGFVFFIIFSCMLYLTNSAFYSMKNIRNNQEAQMQLEPTPLSSDDITERKKIRLKKKLSENFLLKRSSDVILIIVATSSIILLLQRRKNV